MNRVAEDLRSGRQVGLTVVGMVLTIVGLVALLIQQQQIHRDEMVRMDAQFAELRGDVVHWFREADRVMTDTVVKRNRMWAKLAEKSGVSRADIDEIMGEDDPTRPAHSAGIPDRYMKDHEPD